MNEAAAPTRNGSKFLLLGILSLALLFRLTGIQFGAPLAVHPHEEGLIRQAMDAGAQTGCPGGYENPSAMVYATLLIQGARYLALGAGHPNAYWGDYAENPFPFHLWSRVATAIFGVLGVLAIYLLGREWDRVRGGLKVLGPGSAILLAVHFLHIRESRFATIDIPLATGVTLILWLLLAEFHRVETNIRRMVGVALLVGACCGIHYPAAPLVFPLFYVALANVIRGEGIKIDLSWLVGSGTILIAAVGLGFLFTTPYAVLDSTQFWSDIRYLWFTSVAQPPIHAGDETFLLGYLQGPWMWAGGKFLGLLAFFGFMMAILRREPEDRLLLWFAIPYFLLISLGGGVWGRLFLPLVSLQILWAVRFLSEYIDHPALSRLIPERVRSVTVGAALAAVAVVCAVPSLRQAVLLREVDTRVEAAARIRETLNENDYLLVTPFSPSPPRGIPRIREDGLLGDRKRFEQGSRLAQIETPPLEDYIEDGINTVLYSSFYWEAVEEPHVREAWMGADSYLEFLRDLRSHGREIWTLSPANDPLPFHREEMFAPTFHLWKRLRPGPEIHLYSLPRAFID